MSNRDWSPLFSSATDDWPTPQWLFDALHAEFSFTLDPCASKENAKCVRFFTRDQDGLLQDWGRQTVFMNPPYGRVIGDWLKGGNGVRSIQLTNRWRAQKRWDSTA